MNTLELPQSRHLRRAPHLASLALLDAAIVITEQALRVEHTELDYDVAAKALEKQHPPELRIAALVVDRLRELHALIAIYRDGARRACDDEIPY